MAEEHNAIKYGTALSKAISTAVGGGYGDVGVSRVSETLGPQIDPWARPEWELLRGEILYSRYLFVGAVAARISGIQMLAAPASTKLCVVRRIKRISGAFFLGLDTASTFSGLNPVVNRGVPCDRRFPQIGEVSQTQLISGDFATTVAAAFQQDLLAAANIQCDTPWILPPAATLFMLGNVVNAAMEVQIFFSERTPFPGELQARG